MKIRDNSNIISYGRNNKGVELYGRIDQYGLVTFHLSDESELPAELGMKGRFTVPDAGIRADVFLDTKVARKKLENVKSEDVENEIDLPVQKNETNLSDIFKAAKKAKSVEVIKVE